MKKDITIYDIAKKTGYSPTTVSRALSNHPKVKENTKQQVLEAARESGYQSNVFASNLRRKHTFNIGVIVPRLNSPFQSSALAGMEKVANEAGYNLIISQSFESHDKEVANAKTMFNSRVDGLIVSLARDTGETQHFEPFTEKDIPIIFFDRVPAKLGFTGVVIDNEMAAREATQHLIDQGCRTILHVLGDLRTNVYADRLKGFRRALQENGIPEESGKVIIANLGEEAGEEIIDQLMSIDPLPDGIMVSNDTCAASSMIALKNRGIQVPGQVAVVGFNNDMISRMVEPNLTTVNYPSYQMGEIAMRNLIKKLASKQSHSDPEKNDILTLPAKLIVRASSLRKSVYEFLENG